MRVLHLVGVRARSAGRRCSRRRPAARHVCGAVRSPGGGGAARARGGQQQIGNGIASGEGWQTRRAGDVSIVYVDGRRGRGRRVLSPFPRQGGTPGSWGARHPSLSSPCLTVAMRVNPTGTPQQCCLPRATPRHHGQARLGGPCIPSPMPSLYMYIHLHTHRLPPDNETTATQIPSC